eukprot:515612-Rhodomonas_salina.1
MSVSRTNQNLVLPENFGCRIAFLTVFRFPSNFPRPRKFTLQCLHGSLLTSCCTMDTTDKPQLVEHIHKSLTLTVNDVKWVPCSARFALLGTQPRGTGALQVYALNHGKLEPMMETEKQHGFKCGTFGASSLEERHFATGDYEGRLAVWNLEHVDLPIYS